MNPVMVRNIKIGVGIPKICVPIVGVTQEEIINDARSFKDIPLDIVEWRADWFEDVFDAEKMLEVFTGLREALGETPLLFTFRTAAEGGEKAIELSDYAALIKAVAESGAADLVDIEAFIGKTKVNAVDEETDDHANDFVRCLIQEVQRLGVKVVASNHDFAKTPPQEEIIARLCKMQDLGADIAKIAVMPQTKADVLTLLAATEEMHRQYADRPIITMSMSGNGVISRLCAEVFGSALTFGAAKKASAPGQIGVKDLAVVLDLLHRSL